MRTLAAAVWSASLLVLGSAFADPGEVVWTFPLPAGYTSSAVALAADGGAVIAAGTLQHTGAVFRLNADGVLQWSVLLERVVRPRLAIAPDGTIYCSGPTLHALGADGSPRWEAVLPGRYFGRPTIAADGAVLAAVRAGAEDPSLWNAASVVAVLPDGGLAWEYGTGLVTEDDLTIAPDGGVYVASSGTLRSVATDGRERWVHVIGDNRTARPVAVTRNGAVWGGGHSMFGGDGVRYRLAADGTPELEQSLGALQPLGEPILAPDGTVYLQMADRAAACFSTNGSVCWSIPAQVREGGLALSVNGTLYVTTGDEFARAVRPDGALAWARYLGARLLGRPLLGPDGRVCVAVADGRVVLLEGDGGGPAASDWPMSRRDGAGTGSQQLATGLPGPVTHVAASTNFTTHVTLQWPGLDGARAYEVWRGTSSDPSSAVRIAGPLALPAEFVDREAPRGVSLWYFVRAINGLGSGSFSAAAVGMRPVAAIGELVWEYPTTLNPTAPARDDTGRTVFGAETGELHAVDARGVRLWSRALPGVSLTTPSIAADGTVYIGCQPLGTSMVPPQYGRVVAVDSAGLVRWVLERLDTYVTDLAVAHDGKVVVGLNAVRGGLSEGAVAALSPDGAVVWETPVFGDALTQPPVIDSAGTVYVQVRGTEAEAILALEGETGGVVWRQPGLERPGPMSCLGDDVMAWPMSQGITLLHADGRRTALAGVIGTAISGEPLGVGGGVWWATTYEGDAVCGTGVPEISWRAGLGAWGISAPLVVHHGATGEAQLAVAGTELLRFSLSGELLASNRMPTVVFTSPVLGEDGLLVWGTGRGSVAALRTDLRPADVPWGMRRRDARRTACARTPLLAPGAPESIEASSGTRAGDVLITWLPVAGAQSYSIYRSEVLDFASAERVAIGVRHTNNWSDFGTVSETPYYYWVQAVNRIGVGPPSLPATGYRRGPRIGELLYRWSLPGGVAVAPSLGSNGSLVCGADFAPGIGMPAWRRLSARAWDGRLHWEEIAPVHVGTAAVVGLDGSIYVGLSGGGLAAYGPEGNRRWIFACDSVAAAPAVGRDGRICFPGRPAGRWQAYDELFLLDPDGSLRWRYATGGSVFRPVSLAPDGAVVGVSDDGYLHAVNPDGTRRWRVPVPPPSREAGPAVALTDDRIVLGTAAGSVRVHGLDGSLLWSAEAGAAIVSPPVLQSDRSVVAGTSAGVVLCLDGAGHERWRHDAGSAVSGGVALAGGGQVALATQAGDVTLLSPEGQVLWTTNVGVSIPSPIGITASGWLLVSGGDGTCFVFGTGEAAASGDPWPSARHDPRQSGQATGDVLVPGAVRSTVASAGTFGDRIRVSWDSVPGAWYYEVWRAPTNDWAWAERVASRVTGVAQWDDMEVTEGAAYIYWVRAGNSAGVGLPGVGVRGDCGVGAPGERLEVVQLAPEGTRGLAGLDDGGLLLPLQPGWVAMDRLLRSTWEFGLPNWPPGLPAIAPGRRAVFVAGDGIQRILVGGVSEWVAGSGFRADLPVAVTEEGLTFGFDVVGAVHAFDVDGRPLWTCPTGAAPSAPPVVGPEGQVYVATGEGELSALSPRGRLLWRFRANGRVLVSPAVDSDGTLYVVTMNRAIYALDRGGALRWAALAAGPLTVSPVIGPSGDLIVADGGGLRVYSPDGRLRWVHSADSLADLVVGADGTIYCGTRTGTVLAVDSSGSERWRLPSTGGILPPLVLFPDRRLVFLDEAGHLSSVRTASGPSEWTWYGYRGGNARRASARPWVRCELTEVPRVVLPGDPVDLRVSVLEPGLVPVRWEVIDGSAAVAQGEGAPSTVAWSTTASGERRILVRVVDAAGRAHVTPWVPLEVAPPPRVEGVEVVGDRLRFQAPTYTGRTTRVEVSADLRIWEPGGDLVPGERDGFHSWETPSDPASPTRFYRVRILP